MSSGVSVIAPDAVPLAVARGATSDIPLNSASACPSPAMVPLAHAFGCHKRIDGTEAVAVADAVADATGGDSEILSGADDASPSPAIVPDATADGGINPIC